MTRLAVGFGRGFPRVWALPIAALTLVLGVATFGGLSRSIVADLLAWWPVWVGLAVAAFLSRNRMLGVVRLAGIVPLVAMLVVVLFIWGHLAGWAVMPSAAQRLVGPEAEGVSQASLTAVIDGRIEVGTGSEHLYRVEPIRRAGRIGVPTAAEHVVGPTVAVTLQPPADPGLYSYAGWEVLVSDQPSWTLHLDGSVEADLTGARVSSLEFDGSGVIRLGVATGETPVRVSGSYRVVIPPGAAARVEGVATVPASWTLDPVGAVSPGGDGGWAITVVSGATVNVVEG